MPHVIARQLDTVLTRSEDDSHRGLAEQTLHLYAVALTVMRQFYDSIAAGTTVMPHRVKRLAQRFVTLTEAGSGALLGVAAMANAHRHDAGRAVQSAVLSLLVARQITTDRVMLARLALAALLAEGGRVRAVGPEGRDRLVPLPEALEAVVPPTSAAVCIATGASTSRMPSEW